LKGVLHITGKTSKDKFKKQATYQRRIILYSKSIQEEILEASKLKKAKYKKAHYMHTQQ
jgi:hypothetical protein